MASLTGMNFGKGSSTEAQQAMTVMKSWSFIDEFIKLNGLQVLIIGVDNWDKETDSFEYREDIYDLNS